MFKAIARLLARYAQRRRNARFVQGFQYASEQLGTSEDRQHTLRELATATAVARDFCDYDDFDRGIDRVLELERLAGRAPL